MWKLELLLGMPQATLVTMCLYCSSDKNTLMSREKGLKSSDEYSKTKKDIITCWVHQ